MTKNVCILENRMKDVATVYGADVKIDGNEWAYDLETSTIIIPTEWYGAESNHLTEADIQWDTEILSPALEGYDFMYQLIPMWVWNFYHEVGHHMTEQENNFTETNLRKILAGLNQIAPDVARAGYFELPSEQAATKWAVEEIVNNVLHEWWIVEGTIGNLYLEKKKRGVLKTDTQ